MRQRLLAATLQSLAEDGYRGSTLSSIVRRAGVSRGAQVHHYPSKQALMLDAMEDLLRRTYRKLGKVLLSIAEEDNRLEALVNAVWDQIFQTSLYRAYAELLVESQRDPVLAAEMSSLLQHVGRMFDPAVAHYFELAPNSKESATVMFMQLSSMLAGLASQAHLMSDPAQARQMLSSWVRLATTYLRAKKGVHQPPPRPPLWDRPEPLRKQT